MTEKEIRAVVLARTMLFNYGQGIWSPVCVYMDLCKLTGIKTQMRALPEYKSLQNIPFSFFTKEMMGVDNCDFVLYDRIEEEQRFLSLGTAAKLCWLNNYTSMKHLLFMFDDTMYIGIQIILRSWNRPRYDPTRLPFQVA
jgi:hypothetical protein